MKKSVYMSGLLVIGTSSICGGATTHNNRDGFAGNPRMMDPFSNSTFCKSLSYKHNAKSGVARDAPSCFGCNGRSFPQAKCYPPSVEFPGCNKVKVPGLLVIGRAEFAFSLLRFKSFSLSFRTCSWHLPTSALWVI